MYVQAFISRMLAEHRGTQRQKGTISMLYMDRLFILRFGASPAARNLKEKGFRSVLFPST